MVSVMQTGRQIIVPPIKGLTRLLQLHQWFTVSSFTTLVIYGRVRLVFMFLSRELGNMKIYVG